MILGNGVLARTLAECVPENRLVWVAYDLDAYGNHHAAHTAVCKELDELLVPSMVVLFSPFPVGTCDLLSNIYPDHKFAVLVETVRTQTAVQDFKNTEVFIVGSAHSDVATKLINLLNKPIKLVTPKTAELTKKALNAYLASCIKFGNQIGGLCDKLGVDAEAVIHGLRTDPRVSASAPLMPGGPPSDHLMRDVRELEAIGYVA